jgi:hypothetical protein
MCIHNVCVQKSLKLTYMCSSGSPRTSAWTQLLSQFLKYNIVLVPAYMMYANLFYFCSSLESTTRIGMRLCVFGISLEFSSILSCLFLLNQEKVLISCLFDLLSQNPCSYLILVCLSSPSKPITLFKPCQCEHRILESF